MMSPSFRNICNGEINVAFYSHRCCWYSPTEETLEHRELTNLLNTRHCIFVYKKRST